MVIRPKDSKQLICMLSSAPLVLYGMGGAGLRIAEWCDENNILYVFADKNAESKSKATQRKVILPEQIRETYADANIVVASIIYYEEIKAELLKQGIPKERILSYKIFMPDEILWSDLDGTIDWDLMRFRVAMFSEWISPDVKSVVDYGAGKMYLQEYLASDVRYSPVDYIWRDERTILCDLNTGVFPKLQADVTVCSGVLEFIYTAKALLQHVCKHTNKKIILSYLGVDHFPDIEGRRASAYVSDFSEKQIVDLMKANGFELEKRVEDPVNHACMVYMFGKEADGHEKECYGIFG